MALHPTYFPWPPTPRSTWPLRDRADGLVFPPPYPADTGMTGPWSGYVTATGRVSVVADASASPDGTYASIATVDRPVLYTVA